VGATHDQLSGSAGDLSKPQSQRRRSRAALLVAASVFLLTAVLTAGIIQRVERNATLQLYPGASRLGVAMRIGLGLIVSVLLAWLAKLLTDLKRRREELEALVAHNTAGIIATRRRLEAALERSKRAERAARKSRMRLNVTLAATRIAIWDWDVKRDRWRVSPSYYTNLGYTPVSGAPDREIWLERIHPDDRPMVRRMIEDILNGSTDVYDYEARIRHADGSYRWMTARGTAIKRDERGLPTHLLGVRMDITEHKDAQERIQRLAHFDALTGLPNRVLLNDRVAYALGLAQRQHESLAVLVVGVDKFKNINETLGHRVGDELLLQIAKRLRSVARDDEILARTGGDEFILVLPGADANRAAHVAQQLLDTLSNHLLVEHLELVVTPSIGISLFPGDGRDFDALLKCAGTAVHRAKDGGRNHYVFFTAEMQAQSARTLLLENALRRALAASEFQLYYQPEVSLADGRITGAETLLRWNHPDLGLVSPAEFIPVAEDSGQILEIGEWVLRGAVAQLRAWLDAGLEPLTLAVNLSSVQFQHPDLPALIRQILEEARIAAGHLELELTERIAMGDPPAAIAVLDNLHRLGVRIAIDDFGTGYSSLSYLKRFHAGKLKIDQSFIAGVSEDADDRRIVAAIVNLAGSLGLRTTAEGVETAEQLAVLRAQGCSEAQGFYLSEPVTADRFEAIVREKACGGRWWSTHDQARGGPT
jgi:diguanylate cyclase (GGDEF)-like protein/PAS domain S-box-containing protein